MEIDVTADCALVANQFGPSDEPGFLKRDPADRHQDIDSDRGHPHLIKRDQIGRRQSSERRTECGERTIHSLSVFRVCLTQTSKSFVYHGSV